MAALKCSACDASVYEFASLMDLTPDKDKEISAAYSSHLPRCTGHKPRIPREQLPHRYTDGRPFASRPKGPCAICENGARHHLHYQDGRYL